MPTNIPPAEVLQLMYTCSNVIKNTQLSIHGQHDYAYARCSVLNDIIYDHYHYTLEEVNIDYALHINNIKNESGLFYISDDCRASLIKSLESVRDKRSQYLANNLIKTMVTSGVNQGFIPIQSSSPVPSAIDRAVKSAGGLCDR